MLYYIASWWQEQGGFPVFTYISTRALFGFITALGLSLFLGRPIIHWLFKNGYRDYPRDFGTISTGSKQGTPTMGGVLIAVVALISILLWSDLSSIRVWIVLAAMGIFAGLGFYDDWAKKTNRSAEGGASRIAKILPQVGFGIFLGWLAVTGTWDLFPEGFGDAIYLPFIKEPVLHISWLMIPFGIAWSGGISNAVNYTDGLDGLLAVPAFFCFLVLGIFAYVMGHATIADYLFYPNIEGVGELAIIASIFMGCSLGFLWYNAFPAEVFMGDFGSLMLGGVLMTIAFLIHQEFILVIAGGIFIFQFFSSFIQEIYINKKGRRLFRAAPYHEGLVKNYLTAEPKVVIRFWIIASLLAVVALISLKIR